MDDRRKVITVAHPEHSSGELKIYSTVSVTVIIKTLRVLLVVVA